MRPDLELGIDVFADVLLNASFQDGEVAREKEAQMAAVKAEQDHLVSVAFREMKKRVFGDHPFGLNRNGTTDSIQTLTPQDLRDYHRKHFVGGNLVISVFGDIDRETVEQLVADKFSSLPGGERIRSEEGNMAEFEQQTTELAEEKQQAVLVVGFASGHLKDPDHRALNLIDEACSDMASRLFTRIREEQGLAYYVGCSQVLGMAPGAFAFYLGTSGEQLDHAQAELLDEIARLGEHGLSAEEFERAKKTSIGKHVIENQSCDALAKHAVLDELYGFGFDYHSKIPDEIRRLTLDEVNRVAKKYFHEKPCVISRIVPEPPETA